MCRAHAPLQNVQTASSKLQDTNGTPVEGQNNRSRVSRPGTFRTRGRSTSLTVFLVWATILSISAVLLLLTKCSRFAHLSNFRAGGGRQLSGKEGDSEDDPELDAILELCLELEQEQRQSLQPSEIPQQMHWGEGQSWQHVSGGRGDLHTGTQSASLLAWDGSAPSSSVGTPGFPQGPATQTDYRFLTRSADTWGTREFQGAGPSTSAGVSTMLLPSADGSLPHQGPGTQTGYSFLRGSADMWGSPESLGEGPFTSAGVSTMLLPSADGSVPTASAGYGSSALPAADSAASSFQGFHVPSSAAPLHAPLVFDEFTPGWVLPQAQPWVPPGAPVHDVQPSIQRSMFPAIVGALSVGRRTREEYARPYPLNPRSRYMSFSRISWKHETSMRKPSTSNKESQLLESEWRKMTQGLLSALGNRVLESPSESPSSDSMSSSSCESPVPSTSEDASTAALASGMQKPSAPSSGSPGSSLTTDEPIAAPDDNPTPEPLASTTSPKPAAPAMEHPFYRIPVLEPGAVAWPPSLDDARSREPCKKQISYIMRRMRSLLLQDMILQTDLDGFISKMESLAGHILHFHTMPASQLTPKESVRILGLRYMILDTLFVAREVLGEAANSSSWWEELVANIPEEVGENHYRRTYGNQFEVNLRLTEALCSAIQLLKKGIRPNRDATILLKRQLFCKGTSPEYFKSWNWDPWRVDDRPYSGGSG